ncbi:hypothetical protein [Streptomyces sp. 049-1]|uniref:hypothetical protein n=1 Tax=Streptomyces sp. 049-1 TaxID=2789264 RepID=UPI003980C4E3
MSVRMRHAGIEQDIEVAEISVPVYERSGWKVVDDDVQAVAPEITKTLAKRRPGAGED